MMRGFLVAFLAIACFTNGVSQTFGNDTLFAKEVFRTLVEQDKDVYDSFCWTPELAGDLIRKSAIDEERKAKELARLNKEYTLAGMKVNLDKLKLLYEDFGTVLNQTNAKAVEFDLYEMKISYGDNSKPSQKNNVSYQFKFRDKKFRMTVYFYNHKDGTFNLRYTSGELVGKRDGWDGDLPFREIYAQDLSRRYDETELALDAALVQFKEFLGLFNASKLKAKETVTEKVVADFGIEISDYERKNISTQTYLYKEYELSFYTVKHKYTFEFGDQKLLEIRDGISCYPCKEGQALRVNEKVLEIAKSVLGEPTDFDDSRALNYSHFWELEGELFQIMFDRKGGAKIQYPGTKY